MALTSGTKVGPYEIVDLLGAGGMGEVYRAWDARLSRNVAIKILPASFSANPQRLRRFEQEARAASATNHPNVVAVYDIGTHEGFPFLVIELLEGETLFESLRRGPLPLRKALDVAVQTARGIAAAHEQGIVHRDLKPANLFLTSDGRVKVLDFGLAKLIQPDVSTVSETQAPTLTAAQGTQSGEVLGTVGYMSPEQVRGKPADARSDIFSFGTILYELLSGQRPFQRESSAETMAAILKDDPPELSGENRKIPPEVERVVRHCLEKNPAERFQSARDLAFDLGALSGLSTTSATVLATAKSRTRKWLAPAAALILLAIGAMGERVLIKRSASDRLPIFQQLTFQRGSLYSARFAPDGKTVLYSASWDGQPPQVYSTQPDSPESRPLDLKNSNLFALSSSEMAISLGCHYMYPGECEGTLARLPLSGGAPREVMEHVNSADWSADGNKLAAVRQVEGNFRVEFPLGKPLYEHSGAWLRSVRISPRGDAVAFVDHLLGWGEDAGAVVVLDGSGKQVVRSGFYWSVEGLGWSPRGDEVWFAAANDQQLANEIHSLSLSGKDRVLLRLPGFFRLHDVSRSGHLLLSREVLRGAMLFRGPGDHKDRDLTWLDYSTVSDLSRDGTKVAFSEEGQAAGNSFYAYMRRTDGSPAVKLGAWERPVFSPDGKWVIAASPPGSGNSNRLVLLPTGVGEVRNLTPPDIQGFAWLGWMPDGNHILYAGNDGHDWRIYKQDVAGGNPDPLTPPMLIDPERYQAHLLSPDGEAVFARDMDGKAWLYSLHGASPLGVPGMARDDVWINWSSDAESAFIYRWGEIPARIFRLDLSTGKKQLVAELVPDDPAGISIVYSVLVTPDGKSYAYTSERVLSELYLVDGVK